jgi:hypothetical protein
MPVISPDNSLWRAILDPDWPFPEIWRTEPPIQAAERFAGLLTPALAAHFLKSLEDRLGQSLLDPGSVKQSLLFNRFNGGVQRRWMHEIANTGIPVVYLKGFAFAHTLYPDPDIRTIGDIDILVRDRDLGRLLDFLTGRGFEFDTLPTPLWGFISDASFMPLMSAEGDCNIDIHVQPDCYPAYRSVSADDVFEHAVSQDIDGTTVQIPDAEHAMLLCLTNAAKDKFGVFSVRKFGDIVSLIQSGSALDWDRVISLASAGHFLKPACAVFTLLKTLGLPSDLVPDALQTIPPGLAGRPFARLVADYATMFENTQSVIRVLERELTLCTEPDVAFHNAGLRLKGLFNRRRGIPQEYSTS